MSTGGVADDAAARATRPAAEVVLRVPRVLAADLGGAREQTFLLAPGAVLLALLQQVEESHPALGRRLRDERGELRRFVNVYVDGTDVRRGDGLATPVGAGQTVEVIQSVAGG